MLVILAIASGSAASLGFSGALRLSMLWGAASLGALAARPTACPRGSGCLVGLVALLPWLDAPWMTLGQGARMAATVVLLALWSMMGLRRPKARSHTPSGPVKFFGLLTMLSLWATLGCMGGALSGLVWKRPDSLALNLYLGVLLVVFEHARFDLAGGSSPAKKR